MNAHLIDTHLVVPRSRSSAKVKVKYQGHVSQKMGVSGALVFHKQHLVSYIIYIMMSAHTYKLFTKQQIFRPVQIERVCRRQFKV